MIIECPNCAATIAPHVHRCPACGFAIIPVPVAPSPETDLSYTRFYEDNDGSAAASEPHQPAPSLPPPYPAASASTASPAGPFSPAPSGTWQHPEAPMGGDDFSAYQDARHRGGRKIWPWALAFVLLGGGLVAGYGYMLDGRSLAPLSDAALASGATQVRPPEILEPHATFYATANANVRDIPNTSGSKILRKLERGEQITGDVVSGAGGQSWLKIGGEESYVSLVNLSRTAPVEVAEKAEPPAQRVTASCNVLASPNANATVVNILWPGDSLPDGPKTADGYAEIPLPRGGTGYIADGGKACFVTEPARETDTETDPDTGAELRPIESEPDNPSPDQLSPRETG